MNTKSKRMTYKKVLICGHPCLIGNPPIKPENFKELKPGDKVTQIGIGSKNGKESSSSRVQKFDVPVTRVLS